MHSSLIDKHGAPLNAERPRPSARSFGGRAFEAASLSNKSIGRWRPGRRSPQSALSADRDIISARTEDLDRNNPWASAALQRKLEMVIGSGWKFTSLPDHKRLGITKEQAKELGTEIEAWWKVHCSDTELRNDAAMRESVAMQMGSAFKHRLVTGDALGRIHYVERGAESHTAVELIHSARLKQPTGKLASEKLRDGVELGEFNEAIAYWFTTAHPNDAVAPFKDKQSVRIA